MYYEAVFMVLVVLLLKKGDLGLVVKILDKDTNKEFLKILL